MDWHKITWEDLCNRLETNTETVSTKILRDNVQTPCVNILFTTSYC